MNKLTQIKKLNNIGQTVIFVSEDFKNSGSIEILNKDIFYKPEKNEVLMTELNGKKCFLVGIENETSRPKLKNIAKKFSYQYRKKIDNENTTVIFPDGFEKEQITVLMLGLFEGTYEIHKADSDFIHPFWNQDLTLSLFQDRSSLDLKKTAVEAQILAEGKFTGMDLLNLPPNQKNSEILTDFMKDFAEELGLNFTALNREQAAKEGLHSFLAVGQGSAYEPAFIILEYKPAKPGKKIALVGKCITFDTGGISIKPSENMHYMKSDMGGATTVLGTLLAAVKLKLNKHIIVVFPVTDNAVANNAYYPGDVIGSYSGKTIEVINTDAEGRMTLADGLAYVNDKFKPDVLIDIATLTGSAVRTFGYKCAAMLTVSDEMAEKLSRTGEETGEKVWRLPLWDEYLEDIKSDVADLKHISLAPLSDVIYAGKFLQQFTEEHPNWIHLDIAGVAFGNNDYSKDKSATGYGVELLTEFIREL